MNEATRNAKADWRRLYERVLSAGTPDDAGPVADDMAQITAVHTVAELVPILKKETRRDRLGWTLYQALWPAWHMLAAAALTDEEIALAYCDSFRTKNPWADWGAQLLIELDEIDWDRVWRVILLIVDHARDVSDPLLSYVGAGPLEDWLQGQAELRVEEVEAAVRVDPRFAKAVCVPHLPEWFPEASARIRKAVEETLGHGAAGSA